ncbi:glycosyl hydrolase [Paenibacillus mucilaginosus]|uniref:glucan endo-1,3-beta-D-glucosidase n=1 Tax=Paenibacillus mucilaginosus (strain KNP414) TaxID=1036673 RepID=F8FED9_PAEMK|nr:glycosyl hydrolase [Paenibacillus mucilaginosus]AEI44538.1 glycoside hydrolase family 81 [Paenibacillus mucilaginosus KNP414]MCG7218124.1 fibronectin type III domain-containing protein [Paenibacillus mucilaginosus]WDM26122.1 fibronectin type III domain-containing protein [Paenibacillus mucilaginosus]
MKKKMLSLALAAVLAAGLLPGTGQAFTGEVPLGAGSYSTVLPAGAADVQAQIYKTGNVTGKMPTNDWWSSLAWVQYSEAQYPHPLAVKNQSDGFRIYNPSGRITANSSCVCGWINDIHDFTVGHTGSGTFPDAKVDGFSDWFVKAQYQNGASSMNVSYGHGSPYVYFNFGGGNPQLKFYTPPTVWSGSAGSSVLGITIEGAHYGLFGPTGSTWSGIGTNALTNALNGKTYFSIAALPDNTAATLNKFKQYAYSHVTDTKISYGYNAAAGEVTTTFNYTTSAKEGTQTGTIFALYPHQWKNSSQALLPYTYNSVRGTMKTGEGASFTTRMKFTGVLPALPDKGTYNKTTLGGYINEEEALAYTGGTDTYWLGKRLGKLATLAPIADQVGDTTASAKFRSEIKSRLQDWFKASDASGHLKGSNVFYYNNNWGTLIGYPASFGSDGELNDHHFHYGYYIKAAAEIARTDKAWAQSWGPMVELLVRDIANWNRSDTMFPFLRNFDPYAGHSWASGHARFGDGNNNESSSEAMNAWAGLILWGEATGNTTIRDLGVYLYTTEMNAINDYWFDVQDNTHPAAYTPSVVTMIWGGKGANATWFTANPEQVHGINWLPITAGHLYLTHYPSYAAKNYNALVSENGGTNWDIWRDLIWMYRAISSPADAKNQFAAGVGSMATGGAEGSGGPETGNSKANAYHWIYNLDAMGNADPAITANSPTAAVFNKGGVKTYVAYNFSNSAKTVTFSDGTSVSVPANSFNTGNGGGTGGGDTVAPSAPSGLVSTGKTSSSVSLSWNASTDNVGVTGYTVSYGGNSLNVTGTTATVSGLAAGTAYTFTVTAKDAAGNVSAASSAVTVTTDSAGGGGVITTPDYTASVTKTSATQAKIAFTPTVNALYVDVHYTVNGGPQLNYRMTKNGSTWEQPVDGLSAGSVLKYWFTYEKSGPQYDSPQYTYTH